MRAIPVIMIAISFAVLSTLMPAAATTEAVLYSFTDSGTGYPSGILYLRNGSLYGTGAGDPKEGNGQVFRLTHRTGSWKEKTTLSFDGANGATPFAGLVRDSSGALYGTTWQGGMCSEGQSAFLGSKPNKGVAVGIAC